jgi:transcriptional regulator with XRE-family HTH domain
VKYRVGEKIRMVRERKALTLRQVALEAGVSESLVSQIERNKVSPAIDTLLSIADALDLDLEYLFTDYRRERTVRVLKAGDRQVLTKPGVRYERFAQIEQGQESQKGIEAYQIDIEPGASTGNDDYGHEGSELGVVVEGKAELQVGARRFALEQGDSASFSSDFPHRLVNVGVKTLRVFWVITPPKRDAQVKP